MPTEGQQRMMVKKNYYCPLLLHSKFGWGHTVVQVPSRSQGAFQLLGADKQIPRPE
jgi:hypothetical protein